MSAPDSTCWTLIESCARGDAAARQEFARRYEPPVRAYLAARWRSSPRRELLDDAVQEVFVECLRPGGVLERADPGRRGGFRAFLYGVTRNVARTLERRAAAESARQAGEDAGLEQLAAEDPDLVAAFDRAWARQRMREAAERQAELARGKGEEALRRVELLRLRFHEGLAVRDVARLWQEDPARLHREYAKARNEFRQALFDVVAFHHPGSPAEVEAECRELLDLLG